MATFTAPSQRSRVTHRRHASLSLVAKTPSALDAELSARIELEQRTRTSVEDWLRELASTDRARPTPSTEMKNDLRQAREEQAAARGSTASVVAAPTTATLSCSPAESRDDAAAVLFPLPPPTADEGMDLSVSRKRQREESSDDESSGPHKLVPPAPSMLDDSSLLDQLEERAAASNSSPADGGASGNTVASPPEATTTSSTTEPAAKSPATAAIGADESAGLEATTEHMDDGSAPPPPSVAFLKTPARPPAPPNPRRKKNRKGKRKAAAGSTGAAAATSSPSERPRAPPTVSVRTEMSSAPPVPVPVVSPPSASLPEDEVAFQVVQSRAAQRRARRLDSAALPVNPEVVGTVLFRPSAPGGSFRGLPRLTLAQVLSGRPGVADIRVNHKRNIVAADATSRECLEQLLAVTVLQGIPVAAREPADRRTSTGFLHGVDGEPADDSLLPAIQSPVPVLSASREGRTVALRFEGPVPPEQVSLFRVRFTVRPARPRPLQCRQCGRFGHVKESCSWPNSCIRCGRPHPKDGECQRPRCVNCSGPHPANTPACPRWQQERRVATIMASSTTALSRRVVRAAVREETRTDRDLLRVAPSYASILQGVSKPATPSHRASHRPPPAVAPTSASASQPAAHGPAATAVASSARAPTPATTAVALPAAVPAPPGPAVSTENQEAVDHMVQAVLMAMQFACAQVPAAHPLHAIYQQAWNALSLRVRKTDLSQHLQQYDYDVLALQEVRGTAFDLRLPGYVGYNGATSCTVDSCRATPCLDSNHPQDTPRVAVYVRRELPHVVVDVASATGGPLECCAVTVRLRGVDTTVASIYIRPRRPWDASMLTRLTPLLGRHYLLLGSRRNCCRGKDLMEVVHRLGLQVLNTGSFTHIQRLARTSLTAIDVTLASPGVCYGWATASDSWGSDHLPILVTPAGGKVPRSRRYKVVDWRIYRQLLDDPTGLRDFFGAMTRAAEAATIVTTVPVNQPVPDIHHLNLRAARRRAERTYLRGGSRTAFNRLNAACRRHANQRWRQGWQGICNTVGKSKGGAKAWRLLGSLISGPSLRQPVLTAAIAMNLREDALAEQLADQFSVVAVAPPTAVPDRGAPGLPQGHHPAWAAITVKNEAGEY
ncbi:hypothetical protein HPB52_010659 [Rhipicephalus sanguineus]|uniref:CCHC-type domain-containing protein n=1 Tax=Rhipicephalus sanguineus TaxID=34632 RepID=A0A9D4Q692_RHISA|nr:hypothetical protein HPB52_010659 [Rhipicephalus sanguineus]